MIFYMEDKIIKLSITAEMLNSALLEESKM